MFGLDSDPLRILLLFIASVHTSPTLLIVRLFGINIPKFKVGTSWTTTSITILDAIGLCDLLEHLGVDIIRSVSGSGLWSISILCGVVMGVLRALDVVSANLIVIHGLEFAGSCKYALNSIS